MIIGQSDFIKNTVIAFEHAQIWAALESAGKVVGYYDLIVAATAIEQSSTVTTFNRKHFNSVPPLAVLEP